MSADVCNKCHEQQVYGGVCDSCGDGYIETRIDKIREENARLKSALREATVLIKDHSWEASGGSWDMCQGSIDDCNNWLSKHAALLGEEKKGDGE